MIRSALHFLHRIQRRLYDPWSFQEALRRASDRGTKVRTIVDVGASDGRWSLVARRFFPGASCLLVEAQLVHEPCIALKTAPYGKWIYCLLPPRAQRFVKTRINSKVLKSIPVLSRALYRIRAR
jgi:hypothetical protein